MERYAIREVNVVDVLDRVLDKGIVLDKWMTVSVAGADFLTIEARVVVASIKTYLSYGEQVSLVAPRARLPVVR